VEKISDRAKRYRAHTPGCRPKGPKVCAICGSKRNVVPDHRDGNESNGRASNLRWLCKRHNTKLGKKMAKAGKGVRTRQYNPDKVAGHEGWKQLMASKLAQKYDGLRKSGMTRDQALTETLRSTTAGPGSIALFRKIAKNPGARSLGEYVSAAVSHTRGAHDEAGKIIHETPKSKRREFAAEIWRRRGHNPERPEAQKLSHAAVKFESPSLHTSQACASCVHFIAASPPRCESVKGPIKPSDWCKRFAKNSGSAAEKLYRKFHGRGPDKTRTLLVSEIDPYGSHPELAQLGFLIRFIVGEGVELAGEYGDEVKAAEWVNEISFVPSVARYHHWLENSDVSPQQAKAYLKSMRVPDIAAEPNARQLYVVGGNQNIDSKLVELGADPEKDIADLGFCYLIEYFTQKRFDKFEPTNYWHHFGERTGVQPRLMYDRIHKRLSLAGGEYIVKPAGIDN
jgi:hypothetical protein